LLQGICVLRNSNDMVESAVVHDGPVNPDADGQPIFSEIRSSALFPPYFILIWATTQPLS
jgi:hypothetical protein